MPSSNQIIEAVNTTCARGISIGTAYTEVAAMLDVPRSVVVDVYLRDSNEKIRGVLAAWRDFLAPLGLQHQTEGQGNE